MNSLEKKLKKETDKIRMRANERRAMREQVVSFMEYHPRTAGLSKGARQRTVTPLETYIMVPFSSWQMRSALGVFALFLIVGVPLGAERTVPGDVLYPVKVRINEEVRGSLALTSYQKITWETHRVERRIAEARLLAKEGRLTEEAENTITETVKEHTETARKELAALRVENADDAAVAEAVVASALEVQSAVLETALAGTAEGNIEKEQIRELALAVSDAHEALSPKEFPAPSLSTYERFVAEVEESTTRAHELEASIAGVVTPEEREEIMRRLEDVDRSVVAAKQAYEGSATGDAINGLREALKDTQKVIAFMTDIDVRASIALEQLVPKELTLDERRELVRIAREEIAKSVADLRVYLEASSTDIQITEKVTEVLAQVNEQVNAIDAGLAEGGSLDTAERAEVEATALVNDLLTLTGLSPLEPDIEPVPTPSIPREDEEVGSTTDDGEVLGTASSSVSGDVTETPQ